MNVKVNRITLLSSRNTCDSLLLELDIPNGCYPYNGKASAKLDVASLTGEDYIAENFPDVPVEVVVLV